MERIQINVKANSNAWNCIAAELARLYPKSLRGVRIVVPTVAHAALMRSALLSLPGKELRATGVSTLAALIASQEPDKNIPTPASENQRLLSLYAELRKHEWLKNMISARGNTDMFPLAETLLALCDELTQTMLPAMQAGGEDAEARWEAALAQLPANVRDMLTNESQLVWTIWKSQLDERDAHAIRYAEMMRLASNPSNDLVWISSAEPTPIEEAFLQSFAQKRRVIQIGVDWRDHGLDRVYAQSWPEIVDDGGEGLQGDLTRPGKLSILRSTSLEDEARQCAQTVVDWIAAGKNSLAIIAQDRVVARRIHALLERAQIAVADETGWKLSTTPAAASVMALVDVVLAESKTRALLDLLKCPYVFANIEAKDMHVMAIEGAVRNANAKGGWGAIKNCIKDLEVGHSMVESIQTCTFTLGGSKTMRDWIAATLAAMECLEIDATLKTIPAGEQVLELFEQLAVTFSAGHEMFTLKEWRKFLSMQFEAAAFIAPGTDTRVVMLPLNGARMRNFEGVLIVGADSNHLPSQVHDKMFFANAVRRELGLATREQLQRQQLRDLTEVLQSDAEVVMSYQGSKNGEVIAISPWIDRLQLTLACGGLEEIAIRRPKYKEYVITPARVSQPQPQAPALTPAKISPSGYNSLMSCPYQYFVTRMLGLLKLKDLKDEAEKRNFGEWLHEILHDFHITLKKGEVPDRFTLLSEITERVFARELPKSPSSLGYYARWKRVIPVYLKWLAGREAQGWHFALGEQELQKLIEYGTGKVLVTARVDRIDHHAETGEADVIDYKGMSFDRLTAKLRDPEDQQLPISGLVSKTPAVSGRYVSLEMENPAKADAEADNFVNWMNAVEKRIADNFIAIRSGHALPANGNGTACDYCDVKGVCRKSSWQHQVAA